jgi:spermidine synthase/MFS family permease
MNGSAARFLPYILSFFSSFCIMILELVASRLVARHVGASLSVWTSVIGIMLGGICLGNVLGGRLADRVAPSKAIGPLYALGSLLTLACLWINSVVGLTPGLDSMPWELRTVVVVSLDFLIPATVLGMIGPVVAKMAVEQSKKSGSAIGDVYFMGAVGSIVGTFVAGFYLIYLSPTSTIVLIVAAAYAMLAASLLGGRASGVGLLAGGSLGAGCLLQTMHVNLPSIYLGAIPINAVSLVGCAAALWLGIEGLLRLASDREQTVSNATFDASLPEDLAPVKLSDLAVLSFLASMAFMALEMVAGRLVTRHLGSSIYGWTSVIGVLLGGLSLGNFLGGKIADKIKDEKQASWLFLAASVMTACILLAEHPQPWFVRAVRNPIDSLMQGQWLEMKDVDHDAFLSQAISMSRFPAWAKAVTFGVADHYHWSFRVFFWTAVVFFVPAVTMGTVSPVVAKLAVDRVRRTKRTGSAIGQVYAWGMVGSILGTFLTGFLLIDVLGTKGVLLILAATLALAATTLGSIWHAAWAGIPLGLCVIAFLPFGWFERQGLAWGLREERGDPDIKGSGLAYSDESNYYFIKVSNDPDADGQKRVLVLDNLIHGYFILDHPERLDYDYEHIYALVTRRLAAAKAKAKDIASPKDVDLSTLFLGGGSYTFPRYLQSQYTKVNAEVAEIDRAVWKANIKSLGLSQTAPIKTSFGDARQYVVKNEHEKKFDIVFGDAFNDFSVPWHLTTKEFNDKISHMLTDDGVYMINIIDVYESDETAVENSKTGKRHRAKNPEKAKREAQQLGAFLGSWVETARLTFEYIYVFGTEETPGGGLRETFVVVASKKPIDVDKLGGRDGDPLFYQNEVLFEPKPFPKSDMDQIKVRSRKIILTDDYAPVENLLAPVAETRGDD